MLGLAGEILPAGPQVDLRLYHLVAHDRLLRLRAGR
jgi:hypothetical protein